ncbi:major facilitator superfamily transporter [Nitzschia inconspicua]|uniref:Major facilitator superfamily transporter n=1 Tax=Nitzschia inconspicua TaxID=303405 RepID=A0A9K3LVY2_9STRA|nr:major facilitator superfamily transporter [Nitzschia inconspicua]
MASSEHDALLQQQQQQQEEQDQGIHETCAYNNGYSSVRSFQASQHHDDETEILNGKRTTTTFTSTNTQYGATSINSTSSTNATAIFPKLLPLIGMTFFLAMSMGSTIGIVPTIMTNRFAQQQQYYLQQQYKEQQQQQQQQQQPRIIQESHHSVTTINNNNNNNNHDDDNDTIITTTITSTTTTTTSTITNDTICRYINNNNTNNNTNNTNNIIDVCVQASRDAQTAASISELISNILTLLFSSMVGSMSDIHGRRPFLIVGISLSLLGPITLLWTVLRPDVSPKLYYYAAKPSNGFVHWMVVTLSIVADTLPDHRQRAAGVGLVMAGFWLGLCLGPTMAAVRLSSSNNDHDHDHYVQVVTVSCILQLFGLWCAIFYIPETVSYEASQQARQKKLQQQQHDDDDNNNKLLLPTITTILFRPIRELGIINRNSLLRTLATLAFFSGMATSGDQTLLLYYVNVVLQFQPTDIAVMFLLVGISAVVAQAIVLRPLNHIIGERWVLILCFVAAVFSNILYGLSRNRNDMYFAVCIGALSGMAFPTISAIKANNVQQYEQGRIQGALFSIQAISAGIGPVSMRLVDSITANILSSPHHHHHVRWMTTTTMTQGSMFFFAAMLQFIALVCAYRLPKDKTNSTVVVVAAAASPPPPTTTTTT